MENSASILNAEKLGGGLENHAVNDLLGKMDGIEPDPTGITRPGLLHRNEEPVLLFDGIAATLVIAGRIRLGVQFAISVVKSLAQQNAADRAAGNGDGIVVGQLPAESRATGTQAHIGGSSSNGGAARD